MPRVAPKEYTSFYHIYINSLAKKLGIAVTFNRIGKVISVSLSFNSNSLTLGEELKPKEAFLLLTALDQYTNTVKESKIEHGG